MHLFKTLFRIVRWVIIAYTFWVGAKKTRFFMVGIGLWRLLRRKPIFMPVRKPEFIVLNSADSRIYRRKGWRRIGRRVSGL